MKDLFVSTKAKMCQLGSYMLHTDADRAYCANLPQEEWCKYNCSKIYNGRPLAPFEYTPLSDASWSNQTCSNGFSNTLRPM